MDCPHVDPNLPGFPISAHRHVLPRDRGLQALCTGNLQSTALGERCGVYSSGPGYSLSRHQRSTAAQG